MRLFKDIRRFSVCGFVLLAVCLIAPVVSFGLTVTNLNNAGAGSLRDAVANTAPGGTVDFAVTGTIVLSSEIVIEKNLTIQGPGANLLTISGGNTIRIFLIDTVTVDNVVISGLRFANGNSMSGGGAISYGPTGFDPEDSRFEINKCVFENNTSLSGGAILIFGGGTNGLPDLVIINQSTFRSNISTQGGAISVLPLLTKLEIYNSTFESNSVIVTDGGSAQGGAIYNGTPFPVVSINNSTFESNTVICNADNCQALGGALALSPIHPSVNDFTDISFSTFNNNDAICTGDNCEASGSSIHVFEDFQDSEIPTIMSNIFNTDSLVGNCSITPSPISLGYNLSNDGTCAVGGPGDKPNTNPGLDPAGLQNNGGMTETIALLLGSPAIDMGGPECPPPDTDQRMVPRPQGSACDIGAYELLAARPIPTISEWGLIAMAGVLGVVGLFVIRRRKITA